MVHFFVPLYFLFITMNLFYVSNQTFWVSEMWFSHIGCFIMSSETSLILWVFWTANTEIEFLKNPRECQNANVLCCDLDLNILTNKGTIFFYFLFVLNLKVFSFYKHSKTMDVIWDMNFRVVELLFYWCENDFSLKISWWILNFFLINIFNIIFRGSLILPTPHIWFVQGSSLLGTAQHSFFTSMVSGLFCF
jgi:hypothetical protein